jgi:hypothetical protein
MQTECLIEPANSEPGNEIPGARNAPGRFRSLAPNWPQVEIALRFLQVVDGEDGTPWEKGVERRVDILPRPLQAPHAAEFPFEFGGGAISGLVRLCAEAVDGLIKLTVRVENLSDFPGAETAERSDAIRRSLVGAHTLLSVFGGSFVSSIDPRAAAACRNLNTWPVLVGSRTSRDVMLSSPIILEDYPAVAPESQGDYCDATEIDEILTLRVMTLTDDEKREASATDERARRIIERCDSMPPEIFERLHGAIRSLEPAGATERFFNPAGEDPERQSVEIGNGRVSRGGRVRLAPKRQADTMDLFLAGRIARVEGVHHDVEDRVYVAVTVEDDPGADLHASFGRFFYFYPEELELVGKES